jgi:ankyrin repeat protein
MTAAFGLGRTLAPAAASQQPVDNSTPWVAASEGNVPLLQHALTTLQLTAQCADEHGYTLLQAAASYSQVAVMQWLLSPQAAAHHAAGNAAGSSVDVNAVDNEGDSALHYADKVVAAKFLVETAGMDTSITNAMGKTAILAKQDELNEMMQDEDMEDDDEDLIHLRALTEYLNSLNAAMAQ